jgi:hypothetical protein
VLPGSKNKDGACKMVGLLSKNLTFLYPSPKIDVHWGGAILFNFSIIVSRVRSPGSVYPSDVPSTNALIRRECVKSEFGDVKAMRLGIIRSSVFINTTISVSHTSGMLCCLGRCQIMVRIPFL